MKRALLLILSLALLLAGCGAAPATLPEPAVSTAAPSLPPAPAPSDSPSLPAASPEPSPDRDWMAEYSPVFSCYNALFLLQESDADTDQATAAPEYDLSPNLELFRRSKAKAGYCLEDLDEDGVPELITGLMTDDFYYSNIAAALFTLKEGTPVPVFTSSLRDRIQFLSGGGFLHTAAPDASSLELFICSYADGALTPAYGAVHEGDNGFFLITAGGRENGQRTQVDEVRFNEYTRSLEEMVGSAPILTMMNQK